MRVAEGGIPPAERWQFASAGFTRFGGFTHNKLRFADADYPPPAADTYRTLPESRHVQRALHELGGQLVEPVEHQSGPAMVPATRSIESTR